MKTVGIAVVVVFVVVPITTALYFLANLWRFGQL